MRATNLHICARKKCRLKDIRPFDRFGCVGSDDNGVPARRVPTGRAHRPVLTHRDETKGRTKVLRPDPRFRTSALASVKIRESMATLSRQNSGRRSVDGPVDMQIALLSQKVKDGSRGSVRVACGVRAIGGGSILQEPLAPYLAGGEYLRNCYGDRRGLQHGRIEQYNR